METTNERTKIQNLNLSLSPSSKRQKQHTSSSSVVVLLLLLLLLLRERERCVFLRVHCNKSPHKTKCKSARGDTCLGFRCFGRSFSLFFLNFFRFFAENFCFRLSFVLSSHKKKRTLSFVCFLRSSEYTHTHTHKRPSWCVLRRRRRRRYG